MFFQRVQVCAAASISATACDAKKSICLLFTEPILGASFLFFCCVLNEKKIERKKASEWFQLLLLLFLLLILLFLL